MQSHRIEVDVKERTVAIDGTTYAVSDYHDCLILDVLVKAKGNRMSRVEIQQAEPKLRNKGRIDRRIGKLQATYPRFGQLIESNTKGYRICPSMFV